MPVRYKGEGGEEGAIKASYEVKGEWLEQSDILH